MTTRHKGRGLFQEDWELIEFPDDYVDHGPAEDGWLGFERQHVIDETAAIRSRWTEEEHWRRAGVSLELLIQVYGAGGVYGDRQLREPMQLGASRRVEFGRTLTQEKPDEEPTQEGTRAIDPAASARPIRASDTAAVPAAQSRSK